MRNASLTRQRPDAAFVVRIIGIVLFAYFFFGFMLLPCLNTLTSIFTTKNAAGETDPWAVIRFFFAGNMSRYVWNSLKLALCLVVTVNVVGVSIVLLTEYFDIKGANILRLGYMTTMIYSGVALVTGYLFLYDPNGILTTALANAFPDFNRSWFSGFNAVLFTMTFACTSNHALFLRNAIRGIDYNTVEAARNMGAKPFKVLWKVVFPTLVPTMFSLTVMTFITGLCAMSAPTLLGYDSINPEIVRLAGSSVADESFPQARAALLSIILAMFTIVLLTVLSAYERKGHYLSVSKTKAKLVKQKITNPDLNVLAHVYAYVLFVIYVLPVVLIVLFSFTDSKSIGTRTLTLSSFTLENYKYLLQSLSNYRPFVVSIVYSALAAVIVGVIVVVACRYIQKHKKARSASVLEYSLMIPWLLPTTMIALGLMMAFNVRRPYMFNQVLTGTMVILLIGYVIIKLPFTMRMTKAAFFSLDDALEDASKNLGAGEMYTFRRVIFPVILPTVMAIAALNFNALISDYDMSAFLYHPLNPTLGVQIKSLTNDMNNPNGMALTFVYAVLMMIISAVVLYLVYGRGGRDNMKE